MRATRFSRSLRRRHFEIGGIVYFARPLSFLPKYMYMVHGLNKKCWYLSFSPSSHRYFEKKEPFQPERETRNDKSRFILTLLSIRIFQCLIFQWLSLFSGNIFERDGNIYVGLYILCLVEISVHFINTWSWRKLQSLWLLILLWISVGNFQLAKSVGYFQFKWMIISNCAFGPRLSFLGKVLFLNKL